MSGLRGSRIYIMVRPCGCVQSNTPNSINRNLQRRPSRKTLQSQTIYIRGGRKANMSTTYLSIHDLLRITYTYEARAIEEVAMTRSNSDASTSSYSVCTLYPSGLNLSIDLIDFMEFLSEIHG